MFCSATDQKQRACCGVQLVIDRKWQNQIRESKIKCHTGYTTTRSTYAPEEGKHAETEVFHKELQRDITKMISFSWRVILIQGLGKI